jgi:hypothetical protein
MARHHQAERCAFDSTRCDFPQPEKSRDDIDDARAAIAIDSRNENRTAANRPPRLERNEQ